MARYLVPLILFFVLAGFLYVGLGLNPREVPSPYINKQAPAFDLPRLYKPEQNVTHQDMLGQVWLLNVWASWCVACRQEHPYFVELARKRILPIVGLNYKDKEPAAKGWLQQFGNPYVMSLVDASGRVGIDYGVYGVPETFLIDKQGVIRYKHIGPVTPQSIEEIILPKARELM